jgi:hypothetical protein
VDTTATTAASSTSNATAAAGNASVPYSQAWWAARGVVTGP